MWICILHQSLVQVWYASLSNQHHFHVRVQMLSAPWVFKQSKANQYDLAVLHHFLFATLTTNSQVKKPRLLELMLVFLAGRFAEPSRMCHPLLHCVLLSSGCGLHDAQVSSTLPSNRIKKLRFNMKGVTT